MTQRTKSNLNIRQNQEVRVACAKCNTPTRHRVIFSVDLTLNFDDEIFADESHQIVQCLGCDSTSFRLVRSNSEDFDVIDGEIMRSEYEEVYPPRAAGRPELNDSFLLPYQVRLIYEETHKALGSELYILAAVGIRALVEAVCHEKDAKGKTMALRIDDLVGLGVLTEAGAKILHKVRMMGNAAAHEVKRHDLKTLGTAFDVAENLLQNVYILPAKASRLDE